VQNWNIHIMGRIWKAMKLSSVAPLARLLPVSMMLIAAAGLSAEEQNDEFKLPGFSRTGADTCLRCHGGEDDPHLMEVLQGPHGVVSDPRTPFGGGLQCEACHGPGGDHTGRVRPGQERPPMPAFATGSLLDKQQENQVCLGCHQGTDHRFWDGSAHDLDEVGCADCHQAHVRRDPITVTSTESEVCMGCHIQQRGQFQSAFSHPVRFGEMACSNCHAPHGAPSDGMLKSATLNQNCYGCHAEYRGPFLWEHSPVAEDCSNCHNPHGSNHPSMLTRRAPLLCQQCHSRAGHPSVGLTPEDIEPDTQSVFLLSGSCASCHSQVHGSNHPSGATLNR